MGAYFRIIDKHDPSGRSYYSSLDSLFEDIEGLVGERLHKNGIPIAIEVEGWAELATYEEIWENEDIVVLCDEN